MSAVSEHKVEAHVVTRLHHVFADLASTVRQNIASATSIPPRTLFLGTVLVASAVSISVCVILTQYWSFDVISSLLWVPHDCPHAWPLKVREHCFNDYGVYTFTGMVPNPWAHNENYTAGAMIPAMIFASPAAWLHAPLLGLWGYLLALTIAVFTPAVWAARGSRSLERVMVGVALSVAAIPAWITLDRANSVGFIVPICLVFLIALRRQRWALVAVTVVLAALVKPQFALLAVALFAARQWRMGTVTVCGVLASNVAAFLLWPLDFPHTVIEWIGNASDYNGPFKQRVGMNNVSFANGVLSIPDHLIRLKQGYVPSDFLDGPRSLIGVVVLVVFVVWILALGQRIPSVMAGIVLLSTAALSPAMVSRYYLVFALPIAAVVVRDPDGPTGSGIFDRRGTVGDRLWAPGACVSVAAALTIAQIALPGGVVEFTDQRFVIATTAVLTPIVWLIACAVVLVCYSRRPDCVPDPGRS